MMVGHALLGYLGITLFQFVHISYPYSHVLAGLVIATMALRVMEVGI